MIRFNEEENEEKSPPTPPEPRWIQEGYSHEEKEDKKQNEDD